MKILTVCSGNATNFDFQKNQAFIFDQTESIRKNFRDIEIGTFFVSGRGALGYLKNLNELRSKIREIKADLVHAHGGHVGLLCVLQQNAPVVITFHGSDINFSGNRILSGIAGSLAAKTIVVSKTLHEKMLFCKKNALVVPCGVDLELFRPWDKAAAKKELGFLDDFKYVLFCSAFDNKIKNFSLAQKALQDLSGIKVLGIKDRSRAEVNLLINGAELVILTSFSEGSPQVIKEAMACNCPIVSTDVGDVKEIINGIEGCYLTTFEPVDVADKIRRALNFSKTKGRTNGRERIISLGLDSKTVAGKIVEVYKTVLEQK